MYQEWRRFCISAHHANVLTAVPLLVIFSDFEPRGIERIDTERVLKDLWSMVVANNDRPLGGGGSKAKHLGIPSFFF